MMEILDRRFFNEQFLILTLSIVMMPSMGINLNRALINEVLPAPVLPTIPIFVLLLILKLISRNYVYYYITYIYEILY